jgi:hypothetical protein
MDMNIFSSCKCNMPYYWSEEYCDCNVCKTIDNNTENHNMVKITDISEKIMRLEMDQCKDIRKLPLTLVNLEILNIYTNNHLKSIPSTFLKLKMLSLYECETLSTIPSTLVNLESLECLVCNNLLVIPDTLINLKQLKITSCGKLSYIPSTLVNIEELYVVNNNMNHLPSTLINLRILVCCSCPMISYIPSTFTSLTNLIVDGFPNLITLPSTFVNIYMLSCVDCVSLSMIPETMVKLSCLSIINCKMVQHIPSITNIHSLILIKCPMITSIPDCFDDIPYMKINDCPTLTFIDEKYMDYLDEDCIKIINTNYDRYIKDIQEIKKSRSKVTDMIKYELLDIAMRPDRLFDWYLSEDEKKDILDMYT